MSSNHAHGVSATYGYDDLNRLTSVVDGNLSGSQTTSYTYDSANNVGTVTYPNNIQMQFTYDALNRVATAVSQVSGYSYQRGPTGNLTNVVELGGRTVNWTYDGFYRLTNESIADDSSGNNGAISYSLDAVGNRSSETSSLPGISAGNWGYNADDQVSSETYDANGNVTATGGKSFTYGSENHMMTMTATGTSASIIYDGDGNRVSKTVNGVTTLYLVDDLNPTGYAQVVEELQGGAVTRQYTYGLQRINEIEILNGSWTQSFYGYDGGGNVRQLTNAAGAVTDSYEYDAYGNHWTAEGSTPNNMLYRGEEWDPDLGLVYLRARYMNPLTGRFVSMDPENGIVTDPKTLHKYIYANGDPVNAKDPTGREALVATAELDFWGAVKNAVAVTATGAAVVCVLNTVADSLAIAAIGGDPVPEIGQCKAECKHKTAGDVTGNCTPVGPPVIEPSRSNKGCTSYEQEYLCPCGHIYTIHWITCPGNPDPVHGPHPRPGPPKGGN